MDPNLRFKFLTGFTGLTGSFFPGFPEESLEIHSPWANKKYNPVDPV